MCISRYHCFGCGCKYDLSSETCPAVIHKPDCKALREWSEKVSSLCETCETNTPQEDNEKSKRIASLQWRKKLEGFEIDFSRSVGGDRG